MGRVSERSQNLCHAIVIFKTALLRSMYSSSHCGEFDYCCQRPEAAELQAG